MIASRLVEVGDSAVEVQTAGSGPPTFVVTHPTQSSPDETALVRTLASLGRCVVVVPRGLGRSRTESDESKLGIRRLVDDLDLVRDALDISSWFLLGSREAGTLRSTTRYGMDQRSTA